MGLEDSTFQEIVSKYSPDNIDDVLALDSSEKKDMLSYVRSCYRGVLDDPQCYLLVGPSGVGKTETAYALAKDVNAEVVEINASSQRTEDAFERVMNTYLKNEGIGIGDEKEVIFLVDEVDGIFESGGMGTRDAIDYISDILETKELPVFMTANKEYESKQKLNRLVSKDWVKLVQYDPIKPTKLRQLIQRVNKGEGLGMDSSEMMKIARACNGDVRILFSLLLLPDDLRVETVDSQEVTIYDILNAFYGTKSADECYDLIMKSNYDMGFIFTWLFENVTVYTGAKRTVSRLYEFLAHSDEHIDRSIGTTDSFRSKNITGMFCYGFRDILPRGDNRFKNYNTPDTFDMYRGRNKVERILKDLLDIFGSSTTNLNDMRDRLYEMRHLMDKDKEYRLAVGTRIYNYVRSNYKDKGQRKNKFLELVSYVGHDMLENSSNAEDLWETIDSGDGISLSSDIDKMKEDELSEDEDSKNVDVDSALDMLG